MMALLDSQDGSLGVRNKGILTECRSWRWWALQSSCPKVGLALGPLGLAMPEWTSREIGLWRLDRLRTLANADKTRGPQSSNLFRCAANSNRSSWASWREYTRQMQRRCPWRSWIAWFSWLRILGNRVRKGMFWRKRYSVQREYLWQRVSMRREVSRAVSGCVC